MRKLFIYVPLLLVACKQTLPDKETIKSDTTAQTSTFTLKTVNEQAIYSRAFNAVIWGLPAVNSELMHESLLKAKGDYNQVVYWSGRLNAKNQTITPNPDVIYINPFYDTRKGPVVLPTDPKRGFELLARFYGAEKEFLNKT